MINFYKKFLVSLFLFIFYVGFSATSQDIISKCDDLQSRIASLNISVNSVLVRLQNAKYTTNEQINGEYVERVYPATNIAGVGDSYYILQNYSEALVQMSSDVGMIRQYAASLESNGGSYDDTDLMAQLETIEQNLTVLSTSVDDTKELVMDFMGWFTENQDKITNYFDNWGNFTNSLPSSSYYHYITNKFSFKPPNSAYFGFLPSFRYSRLNKLSNYPGLGLNQFNPYLTSSNDSFDYTRFHSLTDYLLNLAYNQIAYGGSMVVTLYTNTLDTISFHRGFQKDFKSYSDFTTNKITEINSIFYNNSPLEDLQNDVNPSNIYNFVTNYYIKVSTDPSGSASENKTNWFNRIEMLLTALVFRPQETVTSNKFDNANESQSQAFSDSLKSVLNDDITEVQSKSTDVKEQFEKTKTSLLKFFNHLDDKLSSLASMPSHIEFFEVTIKGEKKKVEITTANEFGRLADAFRSITTLCWISFFVYLIYVLSIWLFHKFSTILKFCYAVFKTLIGIG